MRPAWFEESYPWMPAACPNGHELGPGLISLSWVACDCPASDGRGHNVAYCRINGCHEPALPDRCAGVKPQR